MRKIFITYGTEDYAEQVHRICSEAHATGRFDVVRSFSPADLSAKAASSELMSIKRGGGLWLWKPDVIATAMSSLSNGDILVYCDGGCSVYECQEWDFLFNVLNNYHVVAQKIYQPTYEWTRREVVDYYEKTNGKNWSYSFQFCATTIIIKISQFTRKFIQEWRDMMISHPKFVLDVTAGEISDQYKGFRENRHDQTVYNALIYRYLNSEEKDNIYQMWERIEDKDVIRKQAIRATRIRPGETLDLKKEKKAIFHRIIKDLIYKPFVIIPKELYFRNKRRAI